MVYIMLDSILINPSSSAPFVHPGTQLLEISISVISVARFPVSLS